MLKKLNVDTLSLAQEIQEIMVEYRRDIHRHPEIGFEVTRTARVVATQLKEFGLVVKTGIGKTGVVADLVVPGAKKTIALRADLDALAMEELSNVPYKSTIATRAHMCGHDAHSAMLLGAAKLLSSMPDALDVNVRFIFQPNEEIFPGGASSMIEDGVLEGVEEIYALHVWPSLEVGAYGICIGPALAQGDAFDISIRGRGGHAAMPHKTIDPIVIGAQLIQSLQTLVSRNTNPLDNAVVTVTQIHAGTAYNVIPDECKISGTVRTFDKQIQKAIRSAMERLVEGVTSMHGASGELFYLEGYPVTYNHSTQAEKARDAALAIVEENKIHYPGEKTMGGEDFSYYTQKIPGCFIHLGCRNEEKGIVHMLHSPFFDIDEDCLSYGAALLVKLVLNQ